MRIFTYTAHVEFRFAKSGRIALLSSLPTWGRDQMAILLIGLTMMAHIAQRIADGQINTPRVGIGEPL
jgi:hypothetical protein